MGMCSVGLLQGFLLQSIFAEAFLIETLAGQTHPILGHCSIPFALRLQLMGLMSWMTNILCCSNRLLSCCNHLVAHFSGKKKAHKHEKVPGTPAGCPWDTLRDKQGCTGRCPRDLLLSAREKLTQKRAFLLGHRLGVPGTPRRPVFLIRKFMCVFYVCAFSAP